MKIWGIELVDGVEQCWRWISLRAHALNVAFLTTWAMLPQKFQDVLPTNWVLGISVGLLVVGVVGSLVRQKGLDGPHDSGAPPA